MESDIKDKRGNYHKAPAGGECLAWSIGVHKDDANNDS